MTVPLDLYELELLALGLVHRIHKPVPHVITEGSLMTVLLEIVVRVPLVQESVQWIHKLVPPV